MSREEFSSAERVQKSILTRIEKATLLWIAARLPRWVTSDGLTLLGLVSMMGAGLSYWYARYHRAGLLLVIVCLALNWFGDSLDGTVARVRNQQRPRYGFYVDHLVDTLNTLFLVAGLVASGYISLPIGAAALIGFYMISIEVYLATYVLGAFHMSFAGFGPSELRILIAIGNLWLYFRSGVPMAYVLGRQYLLFDVGGAIAAAGMLLMMLTAAARHSRQLYRMERIS
jgi:archaetidylinositol phosphate synthase